MREDIEEGAFWLARARAGSSEALGRLMEFSRQYLLLIANEELDSHLQAKGGASDLVQETQLEAVHAFDEFRGETTAALLGWLRQMLLNNVRDFSRRYTGTAKREVGREMSLGEADGSRDLAECLVQDDPSANAVLERQEREQRVERVLADLPEAYQQVVVWHHRENLSFEEIGTRLGRSEGAVRKLWARAIQQLQERLQDHGSI